MKKTVVVLCGSMKVKDEIIKIKDELEKKLQSIITYRMHARIAKRNSLTCPF